MVWIYFSLHKQVYSLSIWFVHICIWFCCYFFLVWLTVALIFFYYIESLDYITNRPLSTAGGHEHSGVQALQGYPAFPPIAKAPSGPSTLPPLRGDDALYTNRYPAVTTPTTAVNGRPAALADEDNDLCSPNRNELFGNLQLHRKFILMEDPQRESRVRVRITLDQVNMDEIPDSYRSTSAVYPRSYFPLQMKEPQNKIVRDRRYSKNDSEVDGDMHPSTAYGKIDDDESPATIGRTLVPVESVEGDIEVAIPKISRRRRKTDILVNDLGHRMSWSQSRVFSGRQLFLQRSCKFSSSSYQLNSYGYTLMLILIKI